MVQQPYRDWRTTSRSAAKLALLLACALVSWRGFARADTFSPQVTGQLNASPPASGQAKATAWLGKLKALADEGRVDQVVEQVVHHWRPDEKEAAWKLLGQLATRLINWQRREFGRVKLDHLLSEGQNKMAPLGDVGGLFLGATKEKWGPELLLKKSTGGLLARSEKIVITRCNISKSFLISTGSIEVGKLGSTGPNICFANDFVSLNPFGVVVCDGEFNGGLIKADIDNSLVIAREGVTYSKIAGSVVLADGPIRACRDDALIVNSTVLSSSLVEIPKGAKTVNSLIKSNQAEPLGPVKFFDPAQVGVTVEGDKDQVRIKSLDAKSALAKAGLKEGDVVVLLNDTPVKSVSAFRKLLRRGLAEQAIVFDIYRGKQNLSVKVMSKDS